MATIMGRYQRMTLYNIQPSEKHTQGSNFLYFQDHAISSHPNCFVLFGHTEIVVQEVTIGDPKREYYIEVKANAVPTKEELAHALASIEEPIEG